MRERFGPGQMASMSLHKLDWRRLAPVTAVTVAASVFTLLLIFVRLRWAPLESVDRTSALDLNNMIASHGALVWALKAVTVLGSTAVLCIVVGLAVILLAIRRLWRLALYLLVAGAGALVLNPVLKSLVGRLRPVLAHPIAHGTGSSFPSGHALGSTVCYGALLLVFLPAARGRLRTVLIVAVAAIILAVGMSRILLGVHYVSDVVGGWAIGMIWLGITAFAFELTRTAAGQRIADPVAEGLEPEDERALVLAEPERTGPGPARGGRSRGRVAAGIVISWVLILGVIVGLGELITKYGNGNELDDRTVPRWFAAHRTPTETRWSLIFTTLGGAAGIVIGSLVAGVVFLAITRRWRPVAYIGTLLLGEITAFLAAAAIVKRPRPSVSHLDQHLATSAYPSGHTAAACCLYVGIAILAIGFSRGWWRWLFLIPAVAMPVLVALSRMYRGEHHPTDVLGAMLFGVLWLTTVTLLLKPFAIAPNQPASSRPQGRSRAALRHAGERAPLTQGRATTATGGGETKARPGVPAAARVSRPDAPAKYATRSWAIRHAAARRVTPACRAPRAAAS
jgi:undecaprenyl-diphosphatase